MKSVGFDCFIYAITLFCVWIGVPIAWGLFFNGHPVYGFLVAVPVMIPVCKTIADAGIYREAYERLISERQQG